MRNIFAIALVTGSCLHLVLGHSWIACTDYAEKNAALYDHNKCRGYPRSGNKLAKKGGTFGQDTGFDYHPSETIPCRTSRNDQSEYNSENPKAVYYQGQQVVLAHPMKNHGSDVCTNPYIPDNGNFIYRGGKDATSDPTLGDFRKNLVADLGIKDMSKPYDVYPKPGYQNAPAFCGNTDKALGTYSFNVPNNLEPGHYTFIWIWGFNSPQDLYSTCFEVDVVATLAERNAILLEKGFSDTYEPCGGMTSNANIAGNSNPGCTDEGVSTTSTSTTTPTAGSSTTTTTPTPATTASTISPGQNEIPVLALQQSGEIYLPEADSGVVQRIIEVYWECPVTVNYWNAYVIDEQILPGIGSHHRLLQEGFDIPGRKIYYHVSFTEPCELKSHPPLATLISDEK